MLNGFAKVLLISTSLSPLLGAVAVSQIANGEPCASWIPWVLVALLLVFICWAMFNYLAKNAEKHVFTISEFESADKEVLAFLLAYLLPFINYKSMSFTGEWMTSTYILVIIILVIAHAGAFQFNPVMGLFGYHFYSVKDASGVSCLLISKHNLRRKGLEVKTVNVAESIYLSVEGDNV